MRMIFVPLVIVAALTSTLAHAKSLSDFAFIDLSISGTVDEENITVYFNPKEHTVTKSTPWKHHAIQGLDAPTLEFTSGEPYRVQFELFFDRYEEGKSVREVTDKIEKLALADAGAGELPRVVVLWGKSLWETQLIETKTQFLEISPDGTPLSAVMRVTWTAFVPLEDEAPATPQWMPLLVQGPNFGIPALLNGRSVELLHLIDPPLLITSHEIDVDPRRGLHPKVRFALDAPYRLRTELCFGAADARQDVREFTGLIEQFLQRDARTGRPPTTLLTWGTGLAFKCILESFTLRFTHFLDDGTPVRAVMNTTWKEFSPAEEQLKGNPRH